MDVRLGTLIFALTMFLPLGISAQSRNLQAVSDMKLMDKLASDHEEVADQAVQEVLRRGGSIITTLLARKGDKRFFYGTLARDENFVMEFHSPTKNAEVNNRLLKEGKLVTVEVAAIYLVSAVYFDSLQIAQSPYLTDLSLLPRDRRAANTDDVIAKAWNALDLWSEKFKSLGLEKLRESNNAPFADASVRFW